MSRTLSAIAALLLPLASTVSGQEATLPPPAWTGSGQVSFLKTSGNTQTSVLGMGADLKYKGVSPWSASAAAAFNRGSVSGQENLRNLAAALRGLRALDAKSDLFVELTYAADTYAGINSRAGVELGIARRLIGEGPHSLSIEAGLGFAREVRLPMKLAESFAFGRGALKYKYAFSKNADFQNNASYVANLSDSSDWRLANVATISAALNSRFSIKFAHAVNHLNTPPFQKKKTDTTMSAALVAKF